FEFGDELFSDEQAPDVSSKQEFDFAPDAVAAPEPPVDTGGFGGVREEFDFSEDTDETFSSSPASFGGQMDAAATVPSLDSEVRGDTFEAFAAVPPAAAATDFDFGDLDDTVESPLPASSSPVPGALDIDFGDVT